jgi:hypothetical protein
VFTGTETSQINLYQTSGTTRGWEYSYSRPMINKICKNKEKTQTIQNILSGVFAEFHNLLYISYRWRTGSFLMALP